ncbi:MAG TPA: GAF domain-containing protein [Gemmatimonadaceae bacterium]
MSTIEDGAPRLRAELERIARGPGDRRERAQRVADLVRRAGRYRWVAVYDVLATEFVVLAWSGPQAPTHPRFPREHGLNGAAVRTRTAVVVQDVSRDARYLPTLDTTRGEAIFPVLSPSGVVLGTLDVESERENAFSQEDRRLLSDCAAALAPLFAEGEGTGSGE